MQVDLYSGHKIVVIVVVIRMPLSQNNADAAELPHSQMLWDSIISTHITKRPVTNRRQIHLQAMTVVIYCASRTQPQHDTYSHNIKAPFLLSIWITSLCCAALLQEATNSCWLTKCTMINISW